MMDNYCGKTVVITGAAGGIGSQLALKLAEKRALVWALDINTAATEQLSDQASRYGFTIKSMVADLTDEQALQRCFEAITTQANIDVWINNAGISGVGDFVTTAPEDFGHVMQVNLLSTISATRLALAHMEKNGHGEIVNVASIAGHVPAPYMSSYCASKYGVVGFTRALQEELCLRDSPVKLKLVSPGFVETNLIKLGEAQGFPQWLRFLLSKPEQVADAMIANLGTNVLDYYPTLNGKLIRRMYALLPTVTVKSSRMLLAKNIKDIFSSRTLL